MQLKFLSIRNFRGLQDISLRTRGSPTAIVIVGPNAVGKTTVLEALRLIKVFLSPAYDQERELALRDMGLLVPGERTIDVSELAGDPNREVSLDMELSIDDAELAALQKLTAPWARRRLINNLGLAGSNELELVNFLSSARGKAGLQEAHSQVSTEIETLSRSKTLRLGLRFEPNRGPSGTNLFDQEALAILSGRNAGSEALLNYFPADRAMPSGEVTIQLGSADFQQTRQSHLAQPALKYTRLKQHLVSRFLLGDAQREVLKSDFQSVFDHLLFGKSLQSLRLTRSGRLNVTIQDLATKALYDVDRMSSGEKGLLLTVFLMKQTTSAGGVVLLDEPELHLNSAVCQLLLPYLVQYILRPQGLQAIICTHSEEVLSYAYQNEDCELFHLRSATDLSRVEISDRDELEGALRALGSGALDSLFAQGNLYVEGTDDKMILQTAFADRVAKWNIVCLNGRSEVEKTVQQLQATEGASELEGRHSFIFDLDRRPSSLSSTDMVKVLQWDRYCLENYLLDADAIFDALRDSPRDESMSLSRGELPRLLRDRALAQLPGVVARRVYSDLEPENPGLRAKEMTDLQEYEAISTVLAKRLGAIANELRDFREGDWCKVFVDKAMRLDAELRNSWETDWIAKCNGKQVLDEIHKHYGLRIPRGQFKMRIATATRARSSETWKIVRTFLEDAL